MRHADEDRRPKECILSDLREKKGVEQKLKQKNTGKRKRKKGEREREKEKRGLKPSLIKKKKTAHNTSHDVRPLNHA